MSQQPLGRCAVEQLAPEDERDGQLVSGRRERQRQVELGRAFPARQLAEWLERQPRQVQFRRGRVLQYQHHLEQGCVAERPFRCELLDQPLERQVLVRISGERRLANPAEQLGEAWISRQVDAQSERVDEETDQVLDLRPVAVGDGGADDQVLLSRPPGEQGAPGGEQAHEDGRLLAAVERREGGGELAGQAAQADTGPRAGHRRPRPVGRQLQEVRSAGQPLPPEGELGLQGLAAEPAPLPDREVGVLDRQRRQRMGEAGCEHPIERRELADQDADGPAVGDDMVHREEHQVLSGAEAQQGGADERPGGQVERA